MKEKREKTITVRLTEDEYQTINELAYITGQSVSQFTRQVLRVCINASKVSPDTSKTMNKVRESGVLNENIETDSDDSVPGQVLLDM